MHNISKKKLIKYLVGLGYPQESIFLEYPIRHSRRVDLIVKIEKNILLIAEVKDRKALPLENKDGIGLNPIARVLQRLATDLDSQYYLLSNGDSHIWLRTGATGRPEIVNEIPFSKIKDGSGSNSSTIKNIILGLENLAWQHLYGDRKQINKFILQVISVKLLMEMENTPQLEKLSPKLPFLNELGNTYNDKQLLNRAVDLIQRTNLVLQNYSLEVLSYLDQIAANSTTDLTLPRWVTDLMFKLSNSKVGAEVVCLFDQCGMLSSSALLNKASKTESYSTRTEDLDWQITQQLLLSRMLMSNHIGLDFINNKKFLDKMQEFDLALLAPPFNLTFTNWIDSELSDNDKIGSIDFAIDLGLKMLKPGGKLVTVVPDGFLFSKKNEKSRKYFMQKAGIESIISLPAKTFLNTHVKGSILVMTKKPKITNGTFVAELAEIPSNNLLDFTQDANLNHIIEQATNGPSIAMNSGKRMAFWVEKLKAESWHLSHYWFQSQEAFKEISRGFRLIPLSEFIIDLRRGSNVVSDNTGEIPVINPGVIREMELRKDAISYTSKEKLPKRNSKVVVGDIVVNAIGSQRGKAAFIEEDFGDFLVNRHVIAITPNPNIIKVKYLTIALNSEFVQRQLYDQSTGSVIQAVSLHLFRDILIPVPNDQTQMQIIEQFEAINRRIEAKESQLISLRAARTLSLTKLGKEDLL